MIIQIYEVHTVDEALAVANLGVDYIASVVGNEEVPGIISLDKAKEIFLALPAKTKSVALSLSCNLLDWETLITTARPDVLHLGLRPHRIHLPDVEKIKKNFPLVKIMRSISVINEQSITEAKECAQFADLLLLDTYNDVDAEFGATGKTHNWEISKKITQSVQIPVILAGGLGPDNVVEAIQKVAPFGVDSKSKTDKVGSNEKDLTKVAEFVKRVREACK
ncbi:MAG: phosphoribosylanthranilate isomerase [Candidatus Anammoxibacter sp.]